MKTEVTSRELANLLGLASSEISDLSKRKILSSGSKKGTYRLQVSVRNYVEHLRKRPAEQESKDTFKHPGIKRKKVTALVFDSKKSETSPLGVADAFLPRTRIRLLSKRVQSFRLYIRDGRCYTIWDK
jgi:hypothetical protein